MSELDLQPAPTADAPPDALAPTGSVVVTGETVTAGTFNAIGTSLEYMIQEQHIHLSQEAKSAVRPFTCGDGVAVSEAEEEASGERVQLSDGEIDTLVAHLAERRILVLSAERGARKLSAAIYLGLQLRREQKCTGPTVIADSLDRQVKIDLRHLSERDRGLTGRMVIFRKPFGRARADLARVFERTDREGWEQLAHRLRQQNAFLVFTADPGETAPFRDRTTTQGLVHELVPHPRTLLEDAFEGKVGTLANPDVSEALRAGRELLLGAFGFGSSLGEFVDFYVDQFRPELDVAEALSRFHHTGDWLLQELERDFESWTFGFTLALALCTREAQRVPWYDFDRLHRRVRQWLRRDLNQRSREVEDADSADELESHPALSEAPLLRRCRAEIVKDSSTLAHQVQFRGDTPPQRLWSVILDRHRRALTTILPGLRELAETVADDLYSLRVLAATILGRVGEVDPYRMVVPLLDRWIRSPKGKHHGVIGPLLEGVTGSGSERYRALCLQRLKDARAGAATEEEARQAVHAAIGAYAWIGDDDLATAMRELGEIARRDLAPTLAGIHAEMQKLAQVEAEIATRAPSGPQLRTLARRHTYLLKLVETVTAAQAPTLARMEGALVTLCLTAGPIAVMRELRRWIEDGGWKMGVLVALMFLHENGIAGTLNTRRVEVGTAAGGPATLCNALVAALAGGEDEVRLAAGFIGDLFDALSTPHLAAAKLLHHARDSLRALLLDWVREAAPVPAYADAIRRLLVALARTHDGKLRPDVEHVVRSRDLADATDPTLRAFAASVPL